MTYIAPVKVYPLNVHVQRLNDGTTIQVSWNPVSLEAARGFFVYCIILAPISTHTMQRVVVPYNESSINITGIDSNRAYTVTVSISVLTVGGLTDGPSSPPVQISCKINMYQ